MRSCPALSSDGKAVYVGGDDSNIYAVTALNGSKIWSFATGLYPFLDSREVCVGSNDCSLYAVDAVTGSKIWSFATGSYVRCSPALSDSKVVSSTSTPSKCSPGGKKGPTVSGISKKKYRHS